MRSSRSVREVMSTNVMVVGPNDKLSSAADVMKLGRVRHMPVIADGELVGIVSQRDLFHNALLRALGYGGHAAGKLLDMFLVKEAMVTTVLTTTPDASIASAAAVMLEHKVGCLPVMDGDDLVGIITEADFVAQALH